MYMWPDATSSCLPHAFVLKGEQLSILEYITGDNLDIKHSRHRDFYVSHEEGSTWYIHDVGLENFFFYSYTILYTARNSQNIPPFNQNSPKYFQKSKLFDIKYYILKNWIQCFTFRPLFQQNKALCYSKLINTPNITLHLYANINNKVTTRNRLWFYVHMWIKPV